MKVILLRDFLHLGRRGEEKEVKPGYARNYLFPNEMAVLANDANRNWFQQQKKKIDARAAKEREVAETMAKEIAGISISIAKRVGASETLYGSVTASDVAELLEEKGVKVNKRRINLIGGIKTLGEHQVEIDLHHDVTVPVTVHVVSAEGV